MKKQNTIKQSGNILLFILIAILLIGLLTVSLTRFSSNTNETGSYEQNVIVANGILNYAKSIEIAIQTLMAKGCGENEISLTGLEYTTNQFLNPFAPTDKSCHIFEPEGAGVSVIKYDTNDKVRNKPNTARTQVFGTAMHHPDAGDPLKIDLTYVIRNVNSNLCRTINDILDIDNPSDSPPDATAEVLGGNQFRGEFGTSIVPNREIRAAGGELKNKMSGCINISQGSGTTLIYYHILLAR